MHSSAPHRHEFVSPFFLGSCDPVDADIALFGVCWDGTSSFKAGSRFAGFAVREASFGMEEFSFYQNGSLLDIKYADYGDLFLPPGQKTRVLEDIGSAVREIRGKGQFPIAFGGEHLLAYPLIMAAYEERRVATCLPPCPAIPVPQPRWHHYFRCRIRAQNAG